MIDHQPILFWSNHFYLTKFLASLVNHLSDNIGVTGSSELVSTG